MKVFTLKRFLFTLAVACLIPSAYAQFDDVYYDPDNVDLSGNYDSDYPDDNYADEDEVTYYDDDEYEYYDDYDYYYSSRIRRFHRPYGGFDFYDPAYTSFNYYDPYYVDSYYYPGSSIYIAIGGSDYWSYRNWRRWNRYNRWNNFNHYNNWHSPASYYYSYNSWFAPSYNYWGGYHGYHTYSNYYNNYYNSCPSPLSNYYGINHTTVTHVNSGNDRGTYYGPRITGNTGSSPRGPVNPGVVQPVMRETQVGSTHNDVGNGGGITGKPTDVRNGIEKTTTDIPTTRGEGGTVVSKPADVNKPADVRSDIEKTPTDIPTTRGETGTGVVREIPVDKELNRREATPTSKRPVFKPESGNYKPYPTSEREKSPSSNPSTSRPTSERPTSDNPTERPTYRPAPESRPSSPSSREEYTPRSNERGSTSPSNGDTRQSYTPPS
ncbi:MAG: hypothetical protein ABIQ11_02240, partial [Saprospiraceae bacterium]